MKPAKPASATMHEQSFVPPTMRALYFTPPPSAITKAEPPAESSPTLETAYPSMQFDTAFPTPRPSPTQYLIKVQTAAFSADELAAARKLNPTLSVPQIPVHSLCGTVISTPAEDHQNPRGPKFKIGDKVYGLLDYTRDGSAADYALATEHELAFSPQNITASEAAALPLPCLTAWQALFTHARLLESAGVSGGAENANVSSIGSFRVLVTDASESEVGLQVLRLLRSIPLESWLSPSGVGFYETTSTGSANARLAESGTQPNLRPLWICATCSTPQQESFLRQEVNVDEVLIVGDRRGGAENAPDLAAGFRSKGLDPVDLVVDCSRGSTLNRSNGNARRVKTLFVQAHSPAVVGDKGTVLCTEASCIPSAGDVRGDGDGSHESLNEQISKRGLTSRFVAVRPDGQVLQKITDLVEAHVVRGRVAKVMDLVDGADIVHSMARESRGMVVIRVNPFE